MDTLDDWYDIETEEMDKFHKEIKEKWNKRKESLSELIHPKYFDFLESHDTYHDEGIVNIIEVKEKQNGYPGDQRNCRVFGGEDSSLYMYTTGEVEYYFGEEGKYEGESVEYWVNQWTDGIDGDSYQGVLLMELSDGTYWKVGYSC